MKRTFLIIFILLVSFGGFLSASDEFSKIKNSVSEFTLPNGLKFILLEDHSVPIASFVTYVNAGSSDERIGIWGISHILEHMAFKGTSEVGTKNIVEEKKVQEQMDRLFDQIADEKDKIKPDQEKIKALETEINKLSEKEAAFVIPNEFINILTENGVEDLNAGTGTDATMYYFSLPSNKLELWAYLESRRFLDPVFREFYKERNVIMEERRMRYENQPQGKLYEEFVGLAFRNHPYHTLGIGPMSNLERIKRSDISNYFNANYAAKNMIIGVAGDIYPDQLKKMAEKYFSSFKSGKRNPNSFTVEPPQVGEKRVTMYEESQPCVFMGYRSPARSHSDYLKFTILNNILFVGRSSRIYKRMVIDEKSALGASGFQGLPGSKYPGIYLIFTLPNSGKTNNSLIATIQDEIEKIKKTSVTEEELLSAKIRTRVSLINSMESPTGLLIGLISSEFESGSWTTYFDKIQEIEKISTSDIQELAKKYLNPNSCVIAQIEKAEDKKEEVQK